MDIKEYLEINEKLSAECDRIKEIAKASLSLYILNARLHGRMDGLIIAMEILAEHQGKILEAAKNEQTQQSE
jgi:hypothetical protein